MNRTFPKLQWLLQQLLDARRLDNLTLRSDGHIHWPSDASLCERLATALTPDEVLNLVTSHTDARIAGLLPLYDLISHVLLRKDKFFFEKAIVQKVELPSCHPEGMFSVLGTAVVGEAPQPPQPKTDVPIASPLATNYKHLRKLTGVVQPVGVFESAVQEIQHALGRVAKMEEGCKTPSA